MKMKDLKRSSHRLMVLMTRRKDATRAGAFGKASAIQRSIETLVQSLKNGN